MLFRSAIFCLINSWNEFVFANFLTSVNAKTVPTSVMLFLSVSPGSALAAAAADVCIVSKEGELFLTAPFTSAAAGDKLEGAGSAEFAAKAGVAAIVAVSYTHLDVYKRQEYKFGRKKK